MNSQEVVAFENLPTLVGRRFASDSFRVTQQEVDTFEDITGVTTTYEDSLAADYPEGMIEGFHSLALLDYLVHGLVRPDPVTCFTFNYGVDRVRFTAPLHTTDELYFTMEIRAAESRGKGYLMRYHCVIGAVGQERPGMVADWLGLVLPRTTTEFRNKDRSSNPITFRKV